MGQSKIISVAAVSVGMKARCGGMFSFALLEMNSWNEKRACI